MMVESEVYLERFITKFPSLIELGLNIVRLEIRSELTIRCQDKDRRQGRRDRVVRERSRQ